MHDRVIELMYNQSGVRLELETFLELYQSGALEAVLQSVVALDYMGAAAQVTLEEDEEADEEHDHPPILPIRLPGLKTTKRVPSFEELWQRLFESTPPQPRSPSEKPREEQSPPPSDKEPRKGEKTDGDDASPSSSP